MLFIKEIFWFFLALTSGYNLIAADYLSYAKDRKEIIQAEDLLLIGGRLQLTPRESRVDDIFVKHKLEELALGFRNPNENTAGLHFFKVKNLIENSKVFQFVRHMPKGAILHLHTTASVSSEWVVRNMSYMPGLLRCTNKDGISILSFRELPKEHGCTSSYVRVNDERLRSISVREYDRNFEQLINLHTPTPEVEYPTIEQVWTKFQNMFATINDALRYVPAFKAYHYQMLEEMFHDNILYAELRMDFKQLYDLSGRVYSEERSVRELQNIVERFRRQHQNFLGVKVILAVHRNVEPNVIHDQMQRFKALHQKFPKFVIGFDLVGQEDQGRPLYNFIEPLIESLPKTARFFFHAGETNWYGASTDLNLLDAILLNTTRIGHGYALMKHPVLWNAVKTHDIAVEVSPLSNQVLHLVSDLRNHPGAFFMSHNIPMVICNDDPGFWNAKGLSYDFFYAIMSLAPSHAGLKTLKQLVWNSIRYSALSNEERDVAFKILERAWNHFVDDVLQGFII